MSSDLIAERLARLGTGCICDAQGKTGALPTEISPLDPAMSCAGVVETVRCGPGDNRAIHFALAEAKPGSVLFISINGFSNAGHFGEVLATQAKVAKLAGVVIDGSCRDRGGLVELNFPVFARGVNPSGTHKFVDGVRQIPMACGDVIVCPGDYACGDADGVVIVPRAEAYTVVERAENIQAREEDMIRRIYAGETTKSILNLD